MKILIGLVKGECRPFVVDGQQVGLIRPDVLKQLYNYPDVFRIDTNEMKDIVELNPAFRDYAERSENVDKVLRQFKKDETFVTLKGWREEVSNKKQNKNDGFSSAKINCQISEIQKLSLSEIKRLFAT